jgi:hypothetical protein
VTSWKSRHASYNLYQHSTKRAVPSCCSRQCRQPLTVAAVSSSTLDTPALTKPCSAGLLGAALFCNMQVYIHPSYSKEAKIDLSKSIQTTLDAGLEQYSFWHCYLLCCCQKIVETIIHIYICIHYVTHKSDEYAHICITTFCRRVLMDLNAGLLSVYTSYNDGSYLL